MTKKAMTLITVLILSLYVFSGCSVFNDKGEEATLKSDTDSAVIQENFSVLEEQLSAALSSKSTGTKDAFQKNLLNSEIKIVSYKGADDITIALENKLEKTIVINTTGSVSMNSPVKGAVLSAAGNGFTANAKADSIIVDGTDITCDIKAETGSVYIKGKNCTLNIFNENIENILTRNATAVINNYSSDSIEVTLANGTKVTVEKNKTYDVYTNLIREAD